MIPHHLLSPIHLSFVFLLLLSFFFTKIISELLINAEACSWCCSFSAGDTTYLALNSETGIVTLTSDLADMEEDTTLVLTAVATDHGHPPLNSSGQLFFFIQCSTI